MCQPALVGPGGVVVSEAEGEVGCICILVRVCVYACVWRGEGGLDCVWVESTRFIIFILFLTKVLDRKVLSSVAFVHL